MREEKQLLLDHLKELIENSESFVVAKTNKMNSLATVSLRNTLAKSKAEMEVVKKRVFVKAAQSAGIGNIEVKELVGSIAVFFAREDSIGIAKEIFKFSGENQDALEVLCGHFDGKLYNGADVKSLSELPSKDEMRAQFLGLLEAPMAQTLATMEALLTSVIHCLENKCNQEQ